MIPLCTYQYIKLNFYVNVSYFSCVKTKYVNATTSYVTRITPYKRPFFLCFLLHKLWSDLDDES